MAKYGQIIKINSLNESTFIAIQCEKPICEQSSDTFKLTHHALCNNEAEHFVNG